MKISWKCKYCGHLNITDVGGPGDEMISEVIEFKKLFGFKAGHQPSQEFVQKCAGCGRKNKVGSDG